MAGSDVLVEFSGLGLLFQCFDALSLLLSFLLCFFLAFLWLSQLPLQLFNNRLFTHNAWWHKSWCGYESDVRVATQTFVIEAWSEWSRFQTYVARGNLSGTQQQFNRCTDPLEKVVKLSYATAVSRWRHHVIMNLLPTRIKVGSLLPGTVPMGESRSWRWRFLVPLDRHSRLDRPDFDALPQMPRENRLPKPCTGGRFYRPPWCRRRRWSLLQISHRQPQDAKFGLLANKISNYTSLVLVPSKAGKFIVTCCELRAA